MPRMPVVSVNFHCFYQDHTPTLLPPDPFPDPVGRHGQQFCDMLQHQRVVVNRTDLLGKVFASWHNRNADTSFPVSSGTISSLKRTSRLLHYCSSPLLFLPETPFLSEVCVSNSFLRNITVCFVACERSVSANLPSTNPFQFFFLCICNLSEQVWKHRS